MKLSRRHFVATAALPAASSPETESGRDYWLRAQRRIAMPVLNALSRRELKTTMPVEAAPGQEQDRRKYTHLEAIGRLLCGISAWLEANPSAQEAELSRESIRAAVDPHSPDYMNFDQGGQPLVDAAFLALALLRAPNVLWRQLDNAAQSQVVNALRKTRVILPGFSNWLLFSATIEAFFCSIGESWDKMRVDYAVRQINEWYKGDGIYGDGPEFHWDYYNSFVIHPMLLAVVEATATATAAWKALYPDFLQRAVRYAAIQERLIAPDGSFPGIGRSLAYRFGAFHHLANMAWRHQLPEGVTPAQVRCALTAVITRMLDAPGTFDANGFLTIGFCGHQPSVAEPYISTGSLYLCATAFLPLGLPAQDPFWSAPPAPWTQQKLWTGAPVATDHHL